MKKDVNDRFEIWGRDLQIWCEVRVKFKNVSFPDHPKVYSLVYCRNAVTLWVILHSATDQPTDKLRKTEHKSVACVSFTVRQYCVGILSSGQGMLDRPAARFYKHPSLARQNIGPIENCGANWRIACARATIRRRRRKRNWFEHVHGFWENHFLHRPFLFLPDWFYGLLDHLMFILLNGWICFPGVLD